MIDSSVIFRRDIWILDCGTTMACWRCSLRSKRRWWTITRYIIGQWIIISLQRVNDEDYTNRLYRRKGGWGGLPCGNGRGNWRRMWIRTMMDWYTWWQMALKTGRRINQVPVLGRKSRKRFTMFRLRLTVLIGLRRKHEVNAPLIDASAVPSASCRGHFKLDYYGADKFGKVEPLSTNSCLRRH